VEASEDISFSLVWQGKGSQLNAQWGWCSQSVFRTFLEIHFKGFSFLWNLLSSIQQQKNVSDLYRILLLMRFYFFCAKELDRKTQWLELGRAGKYVRVDKAQHNEKQSLE